MYAEVTEKIQKEGVNLIKWFLCWHWQQTGFQSSLGFLFSPPIIPSGYNSCCRKKAMQFLGRNASLCYVIVSDGSAKAAFC